MPFPYEIQPPPAEPEIKIVIDETEYSLTWHNTLVRKFLVGDGSFDHILHEITQDDLIYFFLEKVGGDALRQQLQDARFPVRTRSDLRRAGHRLDRPQFSE